MRGARKASYIGPVRGYYFASEAMNSTEATVDPPRGRRDALVTVPIEIRNGNVVGAIRPANGLGI